MTFSSVSLKAFSSVLLPFSETFSPGSVLLGAGNPSIDGSLSDPELVRKLLECQVASWRAANIRDMALVMAFYQMNLNYRTSHIYANIELSCLNGAAVCSVYKKMAAADFISDSF